MGSYCFVADGDPDLFWKLFWLERQGKKQPLTLTGNIWFDEQTYPSHSRMSWAR